MTPTRKSAFAFRWLIPVVFTLCVLAPNALAQRPTTPAYGAYCMGGIAGNGGANYFSDAFGTPEIDSGTIFKAFKAYLAQKYSIPLTLLGGNCETFSTVEKAEAARQKTMATWRQGKRANPLGPKVEETDWKYAAPTGARTSNKATVAATMPNGEKTACQLIATPALESIIGLHIFAARSGTADPKVVSLIAPRTIASSSCQYHADNGGVGVSVWYTAPFNPKIAKYDLLNYEEHKHAGGDDVTSRDFPYPAAETALDGTYFFKGGANGLTILLVSSDVPEDRTEDAIVARDKRIALKILGLPGRQRLSTHAATAGVVHEPPAYWYAYRTDIIGRVVEGEFQSDWDSSSQFQEAFNTYVDMFSAHCRANLPAHPVALSVTQTANKQDRNGNVVSQRELQSYTIYLDPRFAQKYREYYQSLTSSSGSLGNALAVASGRLSMDDIFAAGNDMTKFFSIETCQSPVMHQLGENLLKAAEGNLPVQGRIRRAPSAADLQPVQPSKPAEIFDDSMPNYSITSVMAGNSISGYCRGLYEPVFALLTPQQDQFQYGHSAEAEVDVVKCASKFDAHEVATHRRIAMHYCLSKYNYFLRGQGNLIGAYRQCIAQNDTLTAFCTMELRYREALQHAWDAASAACPAPQPNNREAWLIEQNAPNDIGPLGVIPPNGPGLPPILLAPMKPGVLQRAGMAPALPRLSNASAPPPTPEKTQVSARPAAAVSAQSATVPRQAATRVATPPGPAVAPRRITAQPPESRAQRAAEQRKLGQELFACEQQALKDHPEHGSAFAKAMQACGQQLRARQAR